MNSDNKKKPLEFVDLKRGMIIKSKVSGCSYVVDVNYGLRVTALSSMDITNIDEWEVVE